MSLRTPVVKIHLTGSTLVFSSGRKLKIIEIIKELRTSNSILDHLKRVMENSNRSQ